MGKQAGGGSSSMEAPPLSRYPMMRSPMGGQQPTNSNTQMYSSGGQFGASSRSIGSRPLSMGHSPSIVGQKRDSSGFAVMGGGSGPALHGGPGQGGASQDSTDGGNFVKLFVGSVPRTVIEDDIRPLFADHGNVLEVALIKDKRTGQQQGCCFIKYATIEEADRAIRALHNQRTLPGGIGPIQVRYADGERERLVEYKLFVGSLNKLATEKEIEEIFAPYGRVDDVYIMRDEQKQSRGCAFVKYPSREMATSAINALSGTYVMRGCDQPLTVRFADPKRPKGGDTRAGPAFGGPGFGPRPQGPLGARPPSGSGGHIGGRAPPTNWRPMGTPNMAPPPHAGTRPYGSPLSQRGGASAIGGPMGSSGSSMNGSLQGPGVGTAPSQQQGLNPPIAQQQIQPYGQQSASSQKPSQLQQQLPLAMQQQQSQLSHSQVQTSQQSVHQFGQQVQSSQPLGQQQPSFGQIPLSQQSLPGYAQPSASQSPVQQHVAPVVQQVASSLQQHHLSIPTIQPQSQLQPQLQLQTQSQLQLQPQTQSQQQQPISLQPQAQTQSNFQSQQHIFLQQQHQLLLMQSPTQSQQQPQLTEPQKQQTYYQMAAVQSVHQQPSWALSTQAQSVVSTPAIAPATVASSASIVASVAAPASALIPVPVSCSWTEHTSPEGYKYYYNSVTGESRWEKPEELTAFEKQQQQQPLPPVQQSQPQPQPQIQPQPQAHQQLLTQAQQLQPQAQSRQQQSQILQLQSQILQPALATPYSGAGMAAHQPIQNLGYGQLQGGNATVEPSRNQGQQHQGLPTMQDWMWKAKPAGT